MSVLSCLSVPHSQSQEDPTLLLSRLMLLDVIGPSQPPIAPQCKAVAAFPCISATAMLSNAALQTHTVFGGSSAPLFGKVDYH